MEMKWIAIMFVCIAFAMAAPEIIGRYQSGQCKIAAIQAKMSAEDIDKLCNFKK